MFPVIPGYDFATSLALCIITSVSALIGTIGSLWVIYAFLFTQQDKHKNRLAAMIAFADLITSSVLCYSIYGPMQGSTSLACQIQASFEQIGDLASTFLTFCMALNIILVMGFKQSTAVVKKLDPYYVGISFSLALGIAATPVILSRFPQPRGPIYGSGALWCWITNAYPEWRLSLYISVWSVFLFNFISYLTIGIRLFLHRRQLMQDPRSWKGTSFPAKMDGPPDYLQLYAKKTSLFLLVFILSWLPGTINSLLQLTPANFLSVVFLFFQAFFYPLRGAFNAYAYWYSIG